MARNTLITGLAVLATALPAWAQDAPPFRLEGLYLFFTTAQQDGAPVCSETWEFAPDGVMLVESGQERVRKRFRTETDRDGSWIVSEMLETNRRPDCMGSVAEGVSPGEQRTHVIPMNDGTIMVCPAPQHTTDGTPYVSECYGRLVRAEDAG